MMQQMCKNSLSRCRKKRIMCFFILQHTHTHTLQNNDLVPLRVRMSINHYDKYNINQLAVGLIKD